MEKVIKKTFRQVVVNGFQFNFLDLPGTDLFKFEILNKKGSNIERVMQEVIGKDVYGISHLIEHLSFKSTRDFTTDEINLLLRNDGTFNAGTTFDRISYWFKTISVKSDLAIKLVCNISFNDLKDITSEEFRIEKDVVSNEVEGYLDIPKTKFNFGAKGKISGLHKDDTLIGVPSTINTFNLEDVIFIKKHFLNLSDHSFNIIYDSTKGKTQKDIVASVLKEVESFELSKLDKTIDAKYFDMMGKFNHGEFTLDSKSKKRLYYGLFDIVKDSITSEYVSRYLTNLSGKTSLTDLIREQNGLSYSLGMVETLNAGKYYTAFICDSPKGSEKQILDLFSQSINQTADNFTFEKYEKFIESITIKRTLENVNQNNYAVLFDFPIWDKDTLLKYSDILAVDVDKALYIMDKESGSYQNMKAQLNLIKFNLNSGKYAMVTN